jgi:hypothetical protein
MTPLLLNFRGVSSAQFMANSNLARDLQMAVTALAKNLKKTSKKPAKPPYPRALLNLISSAKPRI